MSFSPSTPITGAAVTGLTSPTYTITADQSPNANSKQYAVTALGGTQTNVETHSVSKPFTITMFRPAIVRPIPQANPSTGIVKDIPTNSYKLIVRKGAAPTANNVALIPRVTINIDIPAGTETYEPEDIKAMISCAAGTFWAQASGIADTVTSGLL